MTNSYILFIVGLLIIAFYKLGLNKQAQQIYSSIKYLKVLLNGNDREESDQNYEPQY